MNNLHRLSGGHAILSFYLAEEVEAAFLGQMSKVANEVCDGLLVACATVFLENSYRFGGPGDVVRLPVVISPVAASKTSFTNTAPSGNFPSLRKAAIVPGDAYTS
jgi:hypothetical protein